MSDDSILDLDADDMSTVNTHPKEFKSCRKRLVKPFPALKEFAYPNCHFLNKVAIPRQVKILMCFSKNCKCDFRIVMKQRRKPYVFNCPASCTGGPATLAYTELTDIWRFDQWNNVFA
uniref:DBD_Tnp_Mut domain-containing protein n=1 Tax=Strongyloides venezuelensis TaxID=75913 RepID=A0A0K0F2A7_STRVS